MPPLVRYALGDRADRLALDVVPLFETGEDLRRSADVLDEWVSARVGPPERLEVMLGYSDSAKDVGPLSATLLLYDAQAALADWAERHEVALTLFHGRGGSLGPRRRSGEPRDPRAAAGQRRRPVQGDRAGRGDLRAVRQPEDRGAPSRAGHRGRAAGRHARGRRPQPRGRRARFAALGRDDGGGEPDRRTGIWSRPTASPTSSPGSARSRSSPISRSDRGRPGDRAADGAAAGRSPTCGRSRGCSRGRRPAAT